MLVQLKQNVSTPSLIRQAPTALLTLSSSLNLTILRLPNCEEARGPQFRQRGALIGGPELLPRDKEFPLKRPATVVSVGSTSGPSSLGGYLIEI